MGHSVGLSDGERLELSLDLRDAASRWRPRSGEDLYDLGTRTGTLDVAVSVAAAERSRERCRGPATGSSAPGSAWRFVVVEIGSGRLVAPREGTLVCPRG